MIKPRLWIISLYVAGSTDLASSVIAKILLYFFQSLTYDIITISHGHTPDIFLIPILLLLFIMVKRAIYLYSYKATRTMKTNYNNIWRVKLVPSSLRVAVPLPPPFPHTHTRTRTHTDMKCSPTNVTSCCSCTCSYKGTLWWQHCYQTFQEIWLTSPCTTSKKHTLSSSYSVYHCHLFRYKIRLKRTQRAETSSCRSTVFVVSTIRIAFFTCSFK